MSALREGLGRRIRQLRHAAGFTQEELARRAGVDWKHLGTIERGEQNASLDLIERLIRILKIEPWELFVFDLKAAPVPGKTEEEILLRAYPVNPVARYAMRPQTRCSSPR